MGFSPYQTRINHFLKGDLECHALTPVAGLLMRLGFETFFKTQRIFKIRLSFTCTYLFEISK